MTQASGWPSSTRSERIESAADAILQADTLHRSGALTVEACRLLPRPGQLVTARLHSDLPADVQEFLYSVGGVVLLSLLGNSCLFPALQRRALGDEENWESLARNRSLVRDVTLVLLRKGSPAVRSQLACGTPWADVQEALLGDSEHEVVRLLYANPTLDRAVALRWMRVEDASGVMPVLIPEGSPLRTPDAAFPAMFVMRTWGLSKVVELLPGVDMEAIRALCPSWTGSIETLGAAVGLVER